LSEAIFEMTRRLMADGAKAVELDAAALVATGVCTQAEFDAEFVNQAGFQRALLAQLFVDARAAVLRVTAGMKPGLAQLTTAFETYLDYNLTHPQLQELAHRLQFDVQGLESLQRMETGVAMVAQSELISAGLDNCPARAKLLTSLVVYVVRAEYRAGKALADLRAVLMEYCNYGSA